ncbi:Clp protease [Streptomyces armeniacus]|uniref:Clp protease n=1 Tax=Streptomyces armeniacus TaxID=83291 RepID=A0A345XI71_9ACTN|nr:Clp protease [Streptomyces armeniacus]
MFERFSKQARQTVISAQEEARTLHHARVGTEHLLLAVLRRPEEPGAATLVRLGVTVDSCRAAVSGVVAQDTDTLGPEDAEALKAFGIDLDEIRRRTEETFGPGALDGPGPRTGPGPQKPWPLSALSRRRNPRSDGTESRAPEQGHIPFAPRAKKALELSLREAIALKDRQIGVEHVVLALLRSDDRLTRAVFQRLGVDPQSFRELVLSDCREAA